ncbi:sporulation histidine kinase inhibitor Sda [Cohnella soli]|uniref:Sporulation histidine kinase inhibitor Sda n=1 Tax=Cohnella soli TaxID=425005 RepID=A0ABW0HKT5_9BACL
MERPNRSVARKHWVWPGRKNAGNARELEFRRKTWDMLLHTLSDEALLESYFSAIKLNLKEEFIDLLLGEIHKRGIDITILSTNIAPL